MITRPRKERVCRECGIKESETSPFISRGVLCKDCSSEYNATRYQKQKKEKAKIEELASQPVPSVGVKLPIPKSIEKARYDGIHYLSAKAKKEARAHVVDALIKHFQDKDATKVTRQDIEKAVQYLASTGDNNHVTHWYMVIIRVSKSDQAAFRWNALFQDWKRRIGGKQ